MNIKLNIKAFLIASTVALSPSCSGTQPSSGPDVSADVQIVQVDALRKIFLEDSHWDEETEVWSYAKERSRSSSLSSDATLRFLT